jgi:hypothetical protein
MRVDFDSPIRASAFSLTSLVKGGGAFGDFCGFPPNANIYIVDASFLYLSHMIKLFCFFFYRFSHNSIIKKNVQKIIKINRYGEREMIN